MVVTWQWVSGIQPWSINRMVKECPLFAHKLEPSEGIKGVRIWESSLPGRGSRKWQGCKVEMIALIVGRNTRKSSWLEQKEHGEEWEEMRSERLDWSQPSRAFQAMVRNVNFILSIMAALVSLNREMIYYFYVPFVINIFGHIDVHRLHIQHLGSTGCI